MASNSIHSFLTMKCGGYPSNLSTILTVQSRRLPLFGHITPIDDSADAKTLLHRHQKTGHSWSESKVK